jgi:hypothetical protein
MKKITKNLFAVIVTMICFTEMINAQESEVKFLPSLHDDKIRDEDYKLEKWSEVKRKQLINFIDEDWNGKRKKTDLSEEEKLNFKLYNAICKFAIEKGENILRRKYAGKPLTVDDIPYLRLYKHSYNCKGNKHPVRLPYHLDRRKYAKLKVGDWAPDFSLPLLGDKAITYPRCVDFPVPEDLEAFFVAVTKDVPKTITPETLVTDIQTGEIRLSDYRGKKPVVLVHGSWGCYIHAFQIPAWEFLHRKYGERVQFLIMVGLPPHPRAKYKGRDEDMLLKLDYFRISTMEQRMKRIQTTITTHKAGKYPTFKLTIPVLVDGLDSSVQNAYIGRANNGVCVIDADGKIAYRPSRANVGWNHNKEGINVPYADPEMTKYLASLNKKDYALGSNSHYPTVINEIEQVLEKLLE